jgi:hypothetical protein
MEFKSVNSFCYEYSTALAPGYFSCILIMKASTRILWCSQSGDSQYNLANFGYILDMKVD